MTSKYLQNALSELYDYHFQREYWLSVSRINQIIFFLKNEKHANLVMPQMSI